MILMAALMCTIPMTGCGENTTEESESSEVLMIDADEIKSETTEKTVQTTTEVPTEAKTESTSVTSTSTAAKSSTTAKATTKAAANTTKAAGAVTVIDEEESSDSGEETPVENPAEEPVEAATEAPTEAPTLPPEDLTLVLGEDCTQYVTQNPYLDMAEGISCMGEGYDRTYDYGDYIVYSFADYAGTGDYVQEIDLITDAYSTYAGIHVGSTRSDVEAAYGTTENGRYSSSEGGFLMFMYEDDVVTLILYCLD